MKKVILSCDNLILQELSLAKARVTIGRSPHNDIVIDNLTISAEHAVIVTTDTDVFLEDLNSTNGTQINGQPVRRHYLQDGDVLELAQYKIRYVAGNGCEDLSLRSDFREVQVKKNHRPTAALRILNGAREGQEIALAKEITSIGRPGRQVALITCKEKTYSIAQIEGITPALINGQPILAGVHPLVHGDVVEVAGTRMKLSLY